MEKTVLLVGHCGPDSSYLRSAVRSAIQGAKIVSADDQEALDEQVQQGVDLVLFNRELGYGFEPAMGVDQIQRLKATHPALRMMLVSNFPDAQQAAEHAGALPGFGKREIGSKRVGDLLRTAVQ